MSLARVISLNCDVQDCYRHTTLKPTQDLLSLKDRMRAHVHVTKNVNVNMSVNVTERKHDHVHDQEHECPLPTLVWKQEIAIRSLGTRWVSVGWGQGGERGKGCEEQEVEEEESLDNKTGVSRGGRGALTSEMVGDSKWTVSSSLPSERRRLWMRQRSSSLMSGVRRPVCSDSTVARSSAASLR